MAEVDQGRIVTSYPGQKRKVGIAEAATRSGLRGFTPQGLSNTAWAFATAGHAAPELLDAKATEMARRGLREFKPQNLSNTAWAFATAGHAAPELLDAMATEMAPVSYTHLTLPTKA